LQAFEGTTSPTSTKHPCDVPPSAHTLGITIAPYITPGGHGSLFLSFKMSRFSSSHSRSVSLAVCIGRRHFPFFLCDFFPVAFSYAPLPFKVLFFFCVLFPSTRPLSAWFSPFCLYNRSTVSALRFRGTVGFPPHKFFVFPMLRVLASRRHSLISPPLPRSVPDTHAGFLFSKPFHFFF